MTKLQALLILIALTLTACGAPTQVEPTLPAPAIATQPAPTQPPPTPVPPTAAIPPTDASPTDVPTAIIEPTAQPTEAAAPALSGIFDRGEVSVSGSFTLDPATNVLRLSDDFRVDPGPDLYVILSVAEDVTLDFQSFSKVVTSGPIIFLGPLASPSGAQEYAIPSGTDLSGFKTVVIWCKTYSVEFAAAKLRP
jgi:hypothetical protein